MVSEIDDLDVEKTVTERLVRVFEAVEEARMNVNRRCCRTCSPVRRGGWGRWRVACLYQGKGQQRTGDGENAGKDAHSKPTYRSCMHEPVAVFSPTDLGQHRHGEVASEPCDF